MIRVCEVDREVDKVLLLIVAQAAYWLTKGGCAILHIIFHRVLTI